MANQPRKHAAIIKAWADGAEVEFLDRPSGRWTQATTPTWSYDTEYRIKPEPKPDIVGYDFIRSPRQIYGNFVAAEEMSGNRRGANSTIVKLVYNGETGALKSIEPVTQ